jgi:hypothetical protein
MLKIFHRHKWRPFFAAPVVWQKGAREWMILKKDPVIDLCRCGALSTKPFATRHILEIYIKK